MARFKYEITEKELKQMIHEHLTRKLGDMANDLKLEDVMIEVKSKQNYKSEWEVAEFRARIDKVI